jgi:RND family efflux transporter MFP subunit
MTGDDVKLATREILLGFWKVHILHHAAEEPVGVPSASRCGCSMRSPTLRLEQVSRLRLTVPVSEAHVGSIRKGAPVTFKVSAFPERTFEGTIARPSYSLDMKTRSMLVELEVPNASLSLSPGMFAEVQWPVSRAAATLFVPTSAVVRNSERQFVVRVRRGVAEWVDVRRGEVSEGLIEVFGDLRDGDVVVRRGSDEIREPGSRLRPRKDDEPKAPRPSFDDPGRNSRSSMWPAPEA